MKDKNKVVCALCNKEFYSLEAHLMYKHGISCQEYKIRFPGRRIRALSVIQRQRATVMKNYGVDHNSKIPSVIEAHREKCKDFYASSKGLLTKKIQAKKRQDTMLEKYGRIGTTLGRKRTEEEKKKQKATVLQRYGVENVAQDPEIKERLLNATRKAQARRPTNLEMKVNAFLPSYVEYTGDWRFWVLFKNGHRKNPDFVVRPFKKWRKVIEVNSLHYHTLENAALVTKEYKKLGIQCLVIWMTDLWNPNSLKKESSRFFESASSTTTNRTV